MMGLSSQTFPASFQNLRTSGTEKGLPHHLFTSEEFGACFPAFDILSLGEESNPHIALIGRKK